VKIKNNLVLFIEQSEKDMLKLVGQLDRWYKHGCEDSALTEEQIQFLNAVESAHAMMLDISNLNNRTTIYNKIKALYDLTSTSQAAFIIQVADALFNTTRTQDKRYKREMIGTYLLSQINAATDKENPANSDNKAIAKFTELYIQLYKLAEADDDNDNVFIEKVIQFTDNPEVIANYKANDAQKVLETIQRLELRAKNNMNGE
jgi:hypothetical protein